VAKRSGGKSSPYDHTEESESDLSAAFGEAQRLVANDPKGALTPMRVTAMGALVEMGVPIPVAATALGCGNKVKQWAENARAAAEAGKAGGFATGESPHLLWMETMNVARAKAEASLVSAIYQAASTDWKAAAYILERRASKRWNLQTQLQITAKSGDRLEVSSFSTEKLLAMARGLLPDSDIKETKALPADVQDAELVEDEINQEDA
jgi:hypothetical protein